MRLTGPRLGRAVGPTFSTPAHEHERQARKRAEAGWRHLQEIVDQAPVMMATTGGPEHVFTSANRLYLETLGLEDIVGKRVIDV